MGANRFAVIKREISGGGPDIHPPDPQRPNRESDEKALILPLGEESKKITRTLSNDSARQGSSSAAFL